MPFFSVIIPSFNRREMLKSALDSVFHQSFRDYEVIVVDDGSDDSTDEMVAEYGKNIKYLKQENSGVSSARNRGIRKSMSPYIALLDSDDLWHKEKLMRDAEFIKKNPGIKIHQCEDIWIRAGKRVNPGRKHLKKEGWIFPESLSLCMISPSSAVLSRELFDKYGFFDENLHACEDYDLWLRITPFEYIGLIKEKLITRFSGHNDQLSFHYKVMDKFRLYSIIELLKKESLKKEYKEIALAAAIEKACIIKTGALKRNNVIISETLEQIIISLHVEDYKRINSRSLLEI